MALKLSENTSSVITKTVEELGYDLVEIRYVSGRDGKEITVFLDSKQGITLDDCELVSRTLDPILDELDPTNGVPYNFNVSSAGLDRPIKSQKDYDRNAGREVECKLYSPLPGTKIKVIEGVLKGRTDDLVTIEGFDGKAYELHIKQIALMTQLIKFE